MRKLTVLLSASGSPFHPAKTRKVLSCDSERMFTANAPEASTRGKVRVRWSAQNSTSRGSAETEQNEDATIPWLRSSWRAVITVIPVDQRLITARNVSIDTAIPGSGLPQPRPV